MQSETVIYEYKMVIEPQPKSIKLERLALGVIWTQLEQHLDPFVVRCPGQIFSTRDVITPLALEVPVVMASGSSVLLRVTLEHSKRYTAKDVNEGGCLGDARVVLQHIARKIVVGQFREKVGRRYFSNQDLEGNRSSLTIFRGIYCALQLTGDGPQLQIDVTSRALHKRNIIAAMLAHFDAEKLDYDDPETQTEFRKCCQGATVATMYNQRLYKIKAVRFDMCPGDTFKQYVREEGESRDVSFAEYVNVYYTGSVKDNAQPMLEAYAEKDTESVFLIPEFCALTGFNDELRKQDSMKYSKVNPQERIKSITDSVASLLEDPSRSVEATLGKWGMSLDPSPVAVDARPLEVPTVSFTGSHEYVIEDGTFLKYMRNGLKCPVNLENWILIYPEADMPVVDIWMRSLKDIAVVAFGMKMEDPQMVVCSDQHTDLPQKLEDSLNPATQFVLLLTPQKGARRVYQLFKHATCCRYPCITQAVRSETIRKRQSIASVLSRIVLQMNAKLAGPPWHIDIHTSLTAPIMDSPTMVVGIDVFRNSDNDTYVGFAGSLDTDCTEYYSMAYKLNVERGDYSKDISLRIQEAFSNALLQFTNRNEILPSHLLVYRASACESQWTALLASELKAFKHVFDTVRHAAEGPEVEVGTAATYEPLITFVAISKGAVVRFFPTVGDRTKNLDAGTVIDSPAATPASTRSFFLVNHHSTKGTASPTHYTVLYDSINMPLASLQNLTFRLSFLYFNCSCAVKLPAPAQYAKKIAHFIGTAVRDVPAERLLGTLFYL